MRKWTSRFQFVPVCGKPEQTGTLMGAGPGALPSAFICGSFPAGRAGGGPGAFKVQGSAVQGSAVQGSRFKVQRFKVQAFKGPPSSLFKGCDRVQLCCLCCLLLEEWIQYPQSRVYIVGGVSLDIILQFLDSGFVPLGVLSEVEELLNCPGQSRIRQAIAGLGRFVREVGKIIPDVYRAVGPGLDGPGL